MAAVKYFIILLFIFMSGIVSAQTAQNPFIHAQGNKLILNGKEIFLRGVCFGNRVWNYNPGLSVNDHSEIDFERVKSMGMNAVRFYLHYRMFTDDWNPYQYRRSGWDWLDMNIAWAKKNGVYLILNMHVPQGGFQSNGGGGALWENAENQKRLAALWKAIAERYRDEPAIAGYDLLNEPVVTKSIEQWSNLAVSLACDIRAADTNHLIIVENMLGIMGDITTYERLQNFFLLNDGNVMYTFHYYYPFEYTHQNTMWTFLSGQEGGMYPDENRTVKYVLDLEKRFKIKRNKAYLEYELKRMSEFGRIHNVPMYVGEFGLYNVCFDSGRGGLNWVRDMLDLLEENHLHYTYHAYHESAFGIYMNDFGLPDPNYARRDLIELFREKLGAAGNGFTDN